MLEIGAVARELGVSPSTLRTWERRYRLVVPTRGEHGERLYDSEQVQALRRITALIRSGSRARAAHSAAAGEAGKVVHVAFAPSVEAPQRARRVIEELLEGHSDSRFAFNLRLVASELVKNAVLYGSRRDAITIDVELYDDCARLCVHNEGSKLSLRALRVRRRHGGRGLEIVDALADSWAIETDASGTTIRVRVPLEAQDGSLAGPGASDDAA